MKITALYRELYREAAGAAVKEFFRVIALAVVPVAIASIQDGGALNWAAIKVALILATLRFVDKWLHNFGKVFDNEAMTLGLTRF